MSSYFNVKGNVCRPAPKMLIIDGTEVWFPTDEQYRQHGYKRAVYTTPPEIEQGYRLECNWMVEGDTVVQQWEIFPDEENTTPDELLTMLEGIL